MRAAQGTLGAQRKGRLRLPREMGDQRRFWKKGPLDPDLRVSRSSPDVENCCLPSPIFHTWHLLQLLCRDRHSSLPIPVHALCKLTSLLLPSRRHSDLRIWAGLGTSFGRTEFDRSDIVSSGAQALRSLVAPAALRLSGTDVRTSSFLEDERPRREAPPTVSPHCQQPCE